MKAVVRAARELQALSVELEADERAEYHNSADMAAKSDRTPGGCTMAGLWQGQAKSRPASREKAERVFVL